MKFKQGFCVEFYGTAKSSNDLQDLTCCATFEKVDMKDVDMKDIQSD